MIDALDLASLEQFQLDLLAAGFEPRDAEQRSWTGPIAASLRQFTQAKTMRIVFIDGWPFQHPRLFVEGIDEEHVTAGGDVCLWASGAPPDGWLIFAGYLQRIDAWAQRAAAGFPAEDFALDAHLYFGSVRSGTIATVELGRLGLDRKRGGRGEIAGSWSKDGHVLEITRGRKGEIEGRWYFVGAVKVPPRSLDEVRSLLDAGQQKNFDRRYRAVAEHGQPRLFMLVWERELGQEALVLVAEKDDEAISAQAIEVAPTDPNYLKLRAGPDAELLARKRVVVFGAGAIGSNLAMRLAEAGLGHLVAVDGARLRPADVVRHAGNALTVGRTKVVAVEMLAHLSTPWTRVTAVAESPWAPTRVRELLTEADLVVDATGLASFTALLSFLCGETATALVSVALYRGGALGRVRRQALPDDITLSERNPDTGHPLIPPGEEPVAYEPGCSAPVNNASPVAVAAVAATGAEIAIGFLADRLVYADEVIEVYRALEQAPFDKLGRIAP